MASVKAQSPRKRVATKQRSDATSRGRLRGVRGFFATKPLWKPIPVSTIRSQLGLTRKLFARLSGLSERSLADLEGASKSASETQQRRVVEMQRLKDALTEVIRPAFISEWLTTPKEAFDGLKPIEVVERGGIDQVWELIYRLRAGMPT